MEKRHGVGTCDSSYGCYYEGKGKNKFLGTCHHCWAKSASRLQKCWSREGASKGSGKNPSAIVTSSGKGKNNGKGKSKKTHRFPWV